MTTRYLQISQLGFYLTLGSLFKEDGDYSSDIAYFEQCLPAVVAAIKALPCWTQTVDESNDPMQIAPYAFCDFDPDFLIKNDLVTFSFWIQSERVALFPKADAVAMKDAISSAMAATYVQTTTYEEWRETQRNEFDI